MNRLFPQKLSIKENVKFFLVSLKDIQLSEVEEAKAFVDEISLHRASRYAFKKDRDKFIIVQAVLRYLLGKFLDQKPMDVIILRDDFGKPFVAGNPVYFSLSYADDYAFLAVTSGRPLGVDIEAVMGERAIYDSSLLHPSEIEAIEKAEDPVGRFYDYWCAKEALLKALGTGFTEEKPPLLEMVSNGVFQSTDPEAVIYTHLIHNHKISICIL